MEVCMTGGEARPVELEEQVTGLAEEEATEVVTLAPALLQPPDPGLSLTHDLGLDLGQAPWEQCEEEDEDEDEDEDENSTPAARRGRTAAGACEEVVREGVPAMPKLDDRASEAKSRWRRAHWVRA